MISWNLGQQNLDSNPPKSLICNKLNPTSYISTMTLVSFLSFSCFKLLKHIDFHDRRISLSICSLPPILFLSPLERFPTSVSWHRGLALRQSDLRQSSLNWKKRINYNSDGTPFVWLQRRGKTFFEYVTLWCFFVHFTNQDPLRSYSAHVVCPLFCARQSAGCWLDPNAIFTGTIPVCFFFPSKLSFTQTMTKKMPTSTLAAV